MNEKLQAQSHTSDKITHRWIKLEKKKNDSAKNPSGGFAGSYYKDEEHGLSLVTSSGEGNRVASSSRRWNHGRM